LETQGNNVGLKRATMGQKRSNWGGQGQKWGLKRHERS